MDEFELYKALSDFLTDHKEEFRDLEWQILDTYLSEPHGENAYEPNFYTEVKGIRCALETMVDKMLDTGASDDRGTGTIPVNVDARNLIEFESMLTNGFQTINNMYLFYADETDPQSMAYADAYRNCSLLMQAILKMFKALISEQKKEEEK